MAQASETTSPAVPVESMRNGRPERAAPPPPGTFELALVMAGAVSAGAYTAGVVDFLIEALDAWYRRKADGTPDAPPHDLVIKVITGASAGAITGAIAAASLGYQFPPVRKATEQQDVGNPLFDSWVNRIDIQDLLETRDLTDRKSAPISLLDSTKLQLIADRAVSFASGRTTKRQYLADPLHLIFTVTNLRGIPYALNLRGNAAAQHEMANHTDAMRFALRGAGGAAGVGPWSDERELRHPIVDGAAGPGAANRANWQLLGTAALASGAFPIGLMPRGLSRPRNDYLVNRVVVPGDDGKEEVRYTVPTWTQNMPQPYSFLCVDGGSMDNEPIGLAREELAGILGRNPRKGIEANRAVLLIDPFPDPAQDGPENAHGQELLSLGLSLLSAYKEQARFKPVDLALADDDTVYSRFLITPDRGDDAQGRKLPALAAGALGGFSGFLARDYRVHDYLLGRRNCQRFLRCHFTLPSDNPLFDRWPPALKEKYLRRARDDCRMNEPELPIIPLLGDCDAEEPLSLWPVDCVDLNKLSGQIGKRLDAIYGSITLGTWGRLLLTLGWNFFLRKKILDVVMGKIDKALRDRGLLTKPASAATPLLDRPGRA